MTTTITITFDGLFVFVHRNPPKLVVLMANTTEHHPSHHNHPEHPAHIAEIRVGNHAPQPFSGELDLTNCGLIGGSERIRCALPLTSKTKEHVKEKLLSGPFASVDKKIEGRILLPLPQSIRPLSTVDVEWEETPGTWVRLSPAMAGQVELTYQAAGPITIPDLDPPNTGTSIYFSYLPPNPTVINHPPCTPLKHSHMHSPIFQDKAPKFRKAGPCIQDGQPSPGPVASKAGTGGDPVMCTLGNGCPPEDPDCGNG